MMFIFSAWLATRALYASLKTVPLKMLLNTSGLDVFYFFLCSVPIQVDVRFWNVIIGAQIRTLETETSIVMDRASLIKKYTNGEITIVWKPGLCVHSTICWKKATGLPAVFNPAIKPWINMQGSDTENIAQQVMKCPSGALSFYYNNEEIKT